MIIMDLDRRTTISYMMNKMQPGLVGSDIAAGYLKVAGPIDNDSEIAGICIYQAGSLEKARKLAEDDPAVRAGRFVVRAMDWYTQQDALTFRGRSVKILVNGRPSHLTGEDLKTMLTSPLLV